MKILFLINTLGSGGKERRLTELLRVIKLRNEIDFMLVTMSRDIHYKEIKDSGIDINFLLRRSRKDISVFFRLYRLCRDYDPVILHCWDSMSAVYSAPVCKLLNIIFINGMVTNAPARQNILNKHWLRARITFPFSDFIVGNSDAGLKAYNAPENRSRIINNGFDFGRMKGITSPESVKNELRAGEALLVGMVASYSDNKDYNTFFKAAKIILQKRKDIIFLAIGKDTDSQEAVRYIGEQYMHNFRLLGIRTGIESYINVMDICVLSTYTEGISNSILEYMACGKPVVATCGGGTEEIVEKDKTGYLVNPSDPEELAGKIEILANNRDLRMEMGSAGKERISEYFSLDRMINNYMDLYMSLVISKLK